MVNSRVKSSVQEATYATTFTTTSGTPVDVTGSTVTLTSGHKSSLIIFNFTWAVAHATNSGYFGIHDGTALQDIQILNQLGSGLNNSISLAVARANTGQVIKLQAQVQGGSTLSVFGTTSGSHYIQVLNI